MLLWSDVPDNAIYQWTEAEGTKTYLRPSGYLGQDGREGSNGLIINADGDLVLCQHGERILAKMATPVDQPRPRFTPIATNYGGRKLNSPNDVVQASNGTYFFTDPPYGLPQQDDDPAKELSFEGIYRTHVDRTEYIYLLDSSLTRPNGLAFSPDEKYLYVANSDPKRAIWMQYEMSDNLEKIVSKKVFFDATSMVGDKKGLPDGLKVTKDGTIFATGPGGVLVFDPDGTHLGTIETGQATANCAFNADESKLYMTAHSYIFSIDLL
jgi:gluconolactonase